MAMPVSKAKASEETILRAEPRRTAGMVVMAFIGLMSRVSWFGEVSLPCAFICFGLSLSLLFGFRELIFDTEIFVK
jgi:predicted permease